MALFENMKTEDFLVLAVIGALGAGVLWLLATRQQPPIQTAAMPYYQHTMSASPVLTPQQNAIIGAPNAVTNDEKWNVIRDKHGHIMGIDVSRRVENHA